jgi:hypothetical protein
MLASRELSLLCLALEKNDHEQPVNGPTVKGPVVKGPVKTGEPGRPRDAKGFNTGSLVYFVANSDSLKYHVTELEGSLANNTNLFNHHFINSNKERRERTTAGFSWAQVQPHNDVDVGRAGSRRNAVQGPGSSTSSGIQTKLTSASATGGKKKVSVQGGGSSTSSGKQTKLTFASAAGGKKKVSVQGGGSSTSSCKQTKLDFASA